MTCNLNLPCFWSWMLFLLLWVALMYFSAWLTGWQRLARQYPFNGEPFERKRRFCSVLMRRFTHYNGCLTFGAGRQGISVWIWPPFRMGHPALFFPWMDIKMIWVKRYGIRMVELRFRKEPQIPMVISEKLAAYLAKSDERARGAEPFAGQGAESSER